MNTGRTLTEIENIKKHQTEVTELKNAINKLKNRVMGLNSRLEMKQKTESRKLEDTPKNQMVWKIGQNSS